MRVLYFPDWVFTALKAQGYQRSESLCEEVLASILSIDDVVFLSLIQDNINQVVPQSVLDTFPIDYNKGPLVWPSVVMGEDYRDSRLNYTVNGLPENFKTPMDNLGCEMMDENTLVFYPLVPIGEYELNPVATGQHKLDLLDRVIQEIYPYLTYSDLALTPIMRDYLLTAQACRLGSRNPVLKAAA